jgi:hypothetical protein
MPSGETLSKCRVAKVFAGLAGTRNGSTVGCGSELLKEHVSVERLA